MTSISKTVPVHKLNDIVNEYNNTYHRTIKMNQLMLKIIHLLVLRKKLMIEILNLERNHVRISKYKNIFVKGYTPNSSEEVFCN